MMSIILNTVVVLLSLSSLSLSLQCNCPTVIVIVVFVSRDCGSPCVMSCWLQLLRCNETEVILAMAKKDDEMAC
jgi:hypothetical protein